MCVILFLFNDIKSDIKCQKKDSFADYSDLSVLDAKSLKVYNDRGWARELLTAEDRVLLNQRIGEVFHKNSRYVRTTLVDGTVVLDINNKILLLGGTLERPIICNVLVINAVSESDAELFKEDIYAYTEGKYITEEAYKERCRITQDCYRAQIIRHFDSSDYKYQKGQYDSGNRATLPDNWQNYGYTERKQDRRRVSGETQGRISGSGDLIESEYKKKGCSHNDSEINLWEPMDPQEDGKGEDILRETPD